jgi:signal transduction histidine kinase
MHRPLSPEQRQAAFIVAILTTTLALAGALAWQGWRAHELYRDGADAAMTDYASFAGRMYRGRVEAQLYTVMGTAFRPLPAPGAAAPSTPPSRVLEALDAAIQCDCDPAVPARYAFRLDLETKRLDLAGDSIPSGEPELVKATILEDVQRRYPPQWPFTMRAFPTRAGLRYLFYTVKPDHPARGRVVYGFAAASADVARDVFRLVYQHAPLVPNPRPDSLARDSVFTVSVLLPTGDTVYQSPVRYEPRYVAKTELSPLYGGMVLEVAVNPDAARSLLVGGAPRSQVPMLVGLLTLTALLVTAAIVLIWRTTTLARLRADFTTSVSHELRTPLAQIMLFAETMAAGRFVTVADYRREAGVILQEGRRLVRLVENVLHFSRGERLNIAVELKPQPLAPLVGSTIQSMASLAASSDTVIRSALDERLGGYLDGPAIRRALVNLLENALRYGGSGRQIIVGTALENGCARIWVDDGGPGIPVPDRERIWRPFTRLDREAGQSTPGTGIGLAIVRDLVRRHGGRTWVEDSPLGGARFVMELPSAWRTAEPAVVGQSAARV